MEKYDKQQLRDCLLDDTQFKALAEFFLKKHLEERLGSDSSFEEFYKIFIPSLAMEFSAAIEAVESPIEKIFLRSLLLLALKGGILSLIPLPIHRDAELEIAEFADYLAKLRKFMQGAIDETGNMSVALNYWNHEHDKGAMNDADFSRLNGDFIKYEILQLQNSFHFSLQPSFKNFTEDGKTFRPDLLFWIPSKPSLRIVVECDGFAFHSDKKSFVNDRKRDRAFAQKGYRVLRFSGTEIYHDPPTIAEQLVHCLEDIRSREFPKTDPDDA